MRLPFRHTGNAENEIANRNLMPPLSQKRWTDASNRCANSGTGWLFFDQSRHQIAQPSFLTGAAHRAGERKIRVIPIAILDRIALTLLIAL
ncbi:MAG: hypothetical protein DME26_14755 [Verrucomicrobia bacterium]|nr:MAG: hypothetical protein DME26_14755 [Verrucomicrobiota bacterium]